MTLVRHPSPNRWVVYLASQSESDSEVTVELRMSRATANRLARVGTACVAEFNPGRNDLCAEDTGSAVLGLLAPVVAVERVKDRAAASDQQELVRLIDEEVASARAGRP